MELKYKAIACFLIGIFSLSGCTSTFDDLNTNPDTTTKVNASMLASKVILDMTKSASNWRNEFLVKRMFWGEQIDDGQYNRFGKGSFDNIQTLTNAWKMVELSSEDDLDAHTGLYYFLKGWYFYRTTMDMGDIPYSEALNIEEHRYPQYDEQKDVFKGILEDLALADEYFAKSKQAFSGDPFYQGDPIKEDVTEIVLNLKGIAAKLYTDGPKTVRVEAVGPCEVTADNIKQGDDIEILNPEWHIATLGEGGKLVMELTFDKGRGYVPAERNKQAIIEKNDINTLPVDSIYTPVLKVNYNVESTRVGQAIDYDKLTIEVWTDGTINAQEAVSLAARVLTEHLNLFVNLSDEAAGAEIMVEKTNDDKEKALEMTIEELDLSVRSFNCLKRAGINTVEDLVSKSEDEMMKVRNLGRKSLEEVMAKLDSLGFKLNTDDE